MVTFNRKHLVVVPNCNWTGHECDLLIVTQDLRIIDVEIKISRSDFKADADKAKWFHAWSFKEDGPRQPDMPRRATEWPLRVWKHYYCLPAAIWQPEMTATASPASGIMLICEKRDGSLDVKVQRTAKPNRDAQKIGAEDAVDIARLASLRMWETYREVDRITRLYNMLRA